MKKLKKSAYELAAGNLDVEIDTERGDELGSVAKSFDIMRSNIRKYIKKIELKNKKLQHMTQKLYGGRLNAMENLGAGISHEINQPLTIIKLKTDYLLKTFSPDHFFRAKKHKKFGKILRKNIFQLKRVDDILKKMQILVADDPGLLNRINLKEPANLVLRRRNSSGDADA